MARKKRGRRTPGEGSVHYRKDTGKYQGAIVVGVTPAGNPRRIKKSFDTRPAAVAWVNERLTELHGGLQIDSNATLYDAYDAWMNNGKTLSGWQAATVDSYERTIERLVLPYLGHLRVRDVTPPAIRTLLNNLAEGAPVRNPNRLKLKTDPAKASEAPRAQGPAGMKRAHSYLSLVLNDAVRMGLIPANPAHQVTPPTPPEPVVQRWSEEEMASVVRRALERDDQVSRYVLIGLGTGLRTEEILGLTWAAVNLEERILFVEQVASSTGPKETRAGGKTAAAKRPLPFDTVTAGALERQREYVQELPAIRDAENEKRAAAGKELLPWHDLDLVFCTRYGTLWDRGTLRRQFNELQDEAQVNRIRLYATRSTHGSTLADAGVNLHALAERLGHTDPRFTAKKYLRGSTAAHRSVADKIGRILEAAGRGSSGADGSAIPLTAAPNAVSVGGGHGVELSPQSRLEPHGT